MLLSAGLTIERTITSITSKRGCTSLSFGLSVIRADILYTSWAMVWVVGASVLTFIIVGFKTASEKITVSKEPRETDHDVKVLMVVQEYKLFVLTWTKGVNAVTACLVNDQ